MKVIVPIEVTDAKLVATNLTEDDHAEWASGTTYARGDFVISTGTHTVYRSLTEGNAGNDPDLETAAFADPLIDDPVTQNWQVISATNRWMPFDQKPSIRAQNAESIVLEVAPGEFIGGIAGFNLTGTLVSIEGYIPGSPDEVIYSKQVDLFSDARVVDWYSYYFSTLQPLPDFAVTDVPPYQDAVFRITIANPGGTAKAGQLVFGRLAEFGNVIVPGTGFSGLDFSFVQNDEFGNLTRTQREATQLSDFEIVISNSSVLLLRQQMNELRGGTPAVWIGDERPSLSAILYGFARDYRMVYQTGPRSIFTLQIQGMV